MLMEQATRSRAHFERMLLVCGDQNAGKSWLLRNMLGDVRLGGSVPVQPRVRARALSRERYLAIRFTSPHEANESPTDFHKKIDRASQIVWSVGWRINYACAVQPYAKNRMPGIAEVCEGLQREFLPERVRVVLLAPDQRSSLRAQLSDAEIDKLRSLDVEVLRLDARQGTPPVEQANVRLLADYFDFS
jgi:hypothetical protein